MIELAPSESDDPAFLQLAQRIMNGAISALQMREVYLVQIDNWFDFKWMGWWSWAGEKELKQLFVPPFSPNRVRSENHFVWDANTSRFRYVAQKKPLHVRQPGRQATFAQRIERISKSAAFVWYSGNTVTNSAGSVMLYISGAEGYAWYASFAKDEPWRIADGRQVSRKELLEFENRGRAMESVTT
jgi:hypothetical protein